MENESKSDTLETEDECAAKGGGPLCPCEYLHADFARKLERERNKMTALASDLAGELREVRTAIRNLKNVQGPHHTRIATERLFALLPEHSEPPTP